MVVVLFQIANDSAWSVSRTRHLHSVDETQEYLASSAGRGFDHTPWPRVLRLRQRRSQHSTFQASPNPFRCNHAHTHQLSLSIKNMKCQSFCATKCHVCRFDTTRYC